MKQQILICLSVLALAVGCGKQEAELVPVSGTLKIDGVAAPNILVRFMPDVMENGAGPSSSAITNEKGEFTLKCDDQREGAVPGNHVVTFVDMDEERPAQGEELTRPPRVDSTWTTAAGGTRLTVVAGQPVNIELKRGTNTAPKNEAGGE
ncbi:MAG: hypothetical protein JNL67_21415 [Planctomycetaceae bacterium]|nr:hypothetical protein [Planctomycetaceae bacterium]